MSARTLEERITQVEELVDKRNSEVGFIKEKVTYLCEADIVNSATLTRLYQEQILTNGRIKTVQESVGSLYLKVDGLEQRVQGLDAKVDRIDTKVDGLDKRMDRFDKRMDAMQTTLESVAMSVRLIADKVGATRN